MSAFRALSSFGLELRACGVMIPLWGQILEQSTGLEILLTQMQLQTQFRPKVFFVFFLKNLDSNSLKEESQDMRLLLKSSGDCDIVKLTLNWN